MRRLINLFIFFIGLLYAISADAQVNLEWAIQHHGTGSGWDYGAGIAKDNEGNIVVVGFTYKPNVGVDLFVVKYSPIGNKIYEKIIEEGGLQSVLEFDMVIDAQNNIYITCPVYTEEYGTNYLTYKLNAEADVIWRREFNGAWNGEDKSIAIALDAEGNVYVTGSSIGENNQWDIVTVKYDQNGNQKWVARYDSPSHADDFGYDIVIDSMQYIYVGGETQINSVLIKYDNSGNKIWDVIDQDSIGAKAIELDKNNNIIVAGRGVKKYSSAGSRLWYKYEQAINYKSISIDNANNIYLTGHSNFDFTTGKYDSLGNLIWVRSYDGGGADIAYKIALDAAENIYVSGRSQNLNYNYDYKLIKYDINGNEEWVATYNGADNLNDIPYDLFVDADGNSYITGSSMNEEYGGFCLTLKYDTNGNELWEANWAGLQNGIDYALGIDVDSAGNSYVTGFSYIGYKYKYLTMKLDPSGSINWMKEYAYGKENLAYDVKIDNNGNIYVTGVIANLNIGCATISYDANGNERWVQTYFDLNGASIYCFDLDLDSNNNVYVSGYSSLSAEANYLTMKYDSDGNLQWVVEYNGSPDNVDESYYGIVDNNGNTYRTGNSWNDVTKYDIATVKYDTNGNLVWEAKYNGISSLNDEGNKVAVDSEMNVYVTGWSEDYSTGLDYLTIKYDSNGNQLWVARYNGPSNGDDKGNNIIIDENGNVYVTGSSWDNQGGYQITTIKYDSNGNQLWVSRYEKFLSPSLFDCNLVMDSAGYLYVIGNTINIYGNEDITIIKYDSNGNLIWDTSYNSPNNLNDFYTLDIKIDNQGNIYTVGVTEDSITGYDYLALKFKQTAELVSIKPMINDANSEFPNGIIESDELVQLIGQVKNIGGGIATEVKGILSTSSPIIILDDEATYPNIASGQSSFCNDCYQIIAPSAYRPSLHFDAIVKEMPHCTSCSNKEYNFTYHIGSSFGDVPPSYIFYPYIEMLLHNGIISGCSSNNYCPINSIERQQMAKLICRSMQTIDPSKCVPGNCQEIFSDVNSSNPFCADIEALYNEGVVGGCSVSPMQYCPTNIVKRQEMAKFICLSMEAINPGSCSISPCTGTFNDVDPNNIFCSYIEALYFTGVISGCSDSMFCPFASVSRGQMSKFIVNAFGFSF